MIRKPWALYLGEHVEGHGYKDKDADTDTTRVVVQTWGQDSFRRTLLAFSVDV